MSVIVDPLEWLREQELFPKIYWSNREETFEAAAVGDGGSGETIYAIRSFWGPHIRWIRPEREIFSEKRSQPFAPFLKKSRSCSSLPDLAVWTSSVERALEEIREGNLSKIVLARRITHQFEEPIDPIDLVQALRPLSANRTLFLFQLSPHFAFLGASPERLFRRRNVAFETESLAGTNPFGEKERREFEWVVQGIRESLPFPVTLGPLEERMAGSVSHLARTMHATLPRGTSDEELLETLHPTPAIGGWPKGVAMDALLRWEPFERGYYAGVVGRVTRRESDWVVGIRSAEVAGDELHLFSGAGIVEGSDPAREWDELNRKIAPFEQILCPL